MSSIVRIDSELAGDLGECYYKAFCDKHGWAFISLEQINKNGIKNGIIEFKKGFERIRVKIPDDIIPEIKTISRPYYISRSNPSYVYDFLACKIKKWKYSGSIYDGERRDLCWVEIKTGEGDLSDNQVRTLKRISLDFAVFWIPDIIPIEGYKSDYVKIEWERDTPDSWLSRL